MSKKIAIVYSPEEPKQIEPEFTLVRSPSSPTTRVVQRPRTNSRLLISQPEMNHFNNLISEDIFLREENQVTPLDIINDISEMILSNSEELERKVNTRQDPRQPFNVPSNVPSNVTSNVTYNVPSTTPSNVNHNQQTDNLKQKNKNLESRISELEEQLDNMKKENANVIDHTSNFTNDLPRKAYINLRNEVNKEPDVVANTPNGMVVFNYPEKGILRHTLIDEEIHHCVPSKHVDFLYTTINFYLEPKVVPFVQAISGSVMIDLLKNEVTARCGGTGANYATLKTVIDLQEAILKGEVVSRKEINKVYVANINNMKDNFTKNKNFVISRALMNQSKYAKEMSRDYHPFAFEQGCN